MKNFFKNKKVLVAGGTGLVGIQVLKRLSELGAIVTSVSLDKIKLNLKMFSMQKNVLGGLYLI